MLTEDIINAANLGQTDYLVDQIKKNPSFLHDTDEQGHSLLMRAVIAGDSSTATKLLELGANPNQVASENGFTAMHWAAFYGHPDLILLLHHYGAQIDSKSKTQLTPLYCALKQGHVLAARELQKKGANINAVDSAGNTLLHIAASTNEINLIVLLARFSANLTLLNNDGLTAMEIATLFNHDDICEKLEFLNKLDTDKYDEDKNSLHLAIEHQNEKLVKSLIDAGVNVNAKTNTGKTALHLAILKRNKNIIQILLNSGAQIDLLDNLDHAPIHIAIILHCDDIVKLLNESGSEAEYLGYRERRDLHFVFDNKELAQLLYATDSCKKYNFGGNEIEAITLLANCWEQFKEIDQSFPEMKKNIANLLRGSQERIINKAALIPEQVQINQSVLSFTGHFLHSTPFILTRTGSENFELRLYDRGYFADKDHFDKIKEQYASVRKINIPIKFIRITLQVLYSALNQSRELARLTLFDYIPKTIANSTYTFEEIYQKKYKGKICFWSNKKSVILDRIHSFLKKLALNPSAAEKQIALKKSILIYKKFDIFIHEHVLQNYKNFCSNHPDLEPNKEDIIKAHQDFINKKYEKLNNNSFDVALAEYQLDLENFLKFKKQPNTVPGSEDDIFPTINFPDNPTIPRQNLP